MIDAPFARLIILSYFTLVFKVGHSQSVCVIVVVETVLQVESQA
jgi:hypothetical protein